MEQNRANAPYFRLRETVRDLMRDQLIACAAVLVIATVLYGPRAILMTAAGIVGAVLTEAVWRVVTRSEQTISDLSAVVTGALCAFLLPANLPLWVPLMSAVFAMAVVKLPFGGLGRGSFNAAAAGYCFAAISCATLATTYNSALLSAEEQLIFRQLPTYYFGYRSGFLPVLQNCALPGDSVSAVLSPQMLLRAGVAPKLTAGDILLAGSFGAMGATACLLLIACGVWLYFRGAVAWQASLAYCASVVVCSFFSKWDCTTRGMSVVYDLLTGSTLFCAVFLIGDLMTAPHMRSGRVVYGIGAGFLTILLRRTGAVEGGEVFSVLLMNACASSIDRLVWKLRRRGLSVTVARDKLLAVLRKRFKMGNNPFDSFDPDEVMNGAQDDDEPPARPTAPPDRTRTGDDASGLRTAGDTLYRPRPELDGAGRYSATDEGDYE